MVEHSTGAFRCSMLIASNVCRLHAPVTVRTMLLNKVFTSRNRAGDHNWTSPQPSHQQTSWSSPGSRTLWVSSPPSINIWPQPAVYSYSPVGSIGLGSFLFYSLLGFMALRSLHGLFSGGSHHHGLKAAYHGEGFTTARVQVALLSSARWIQSELETFADQADSNSQADLNSILQGML